MKVFRGPKPEVERVASDPDVERQALFERLVALHSREIFGFLERLTGNHHDAEELAQDVFIKAHRAIETLRDAEAARRWLFTIAVNQFHDWLKPRKRTFVRAAGDLQDLDSEPGRSDRPPQEAMARELSARLEEWTQALPDRQRTVLLLHAHRGFAYDEIAGMLGISVDAVKMSLFHAREKLRARLERAAP